MSKIEQLHVVTGYDKALGRRNTISKPMSKADADKFKDDWNKTNKTALPKYRYVIQLKVEKC